MDARVGRLVTWGDHHRDVGDAVLAVFAAAPIVVVGAFRLWDRQEFEGRGPDLWFWLLVTLVVAPLVWRRRATVAAATIGLAAYAIVLVAGYGEVGTILPAIILAHSLGNHVEGSSHRRIVRTLVSAGLVAVVVRVVQGTLEPTTFVVVAAYFRGQSVRNRREYLAELLRRVETADALSAERATIAVSAERGRIAREVHDVVAHGLSVVVVQAGAAQRVIMNDPDRASVALGHIESTGRSALVEMRQLLNVMRDRDAAVDGELLLSPLPGGGDLGSLVASFTAVGLQVDLSADQGVSDLPEMIGLTVYRVIQEGLTNVLKHAGPATATVSVDVLADTVTVVVADNGRGAAATAGSSGHGLAGMAERVSLVGGMLTVGPCGTGGFEVRASMPSLLAPVGSAT